MAKVTATSSDGNLGFTFTTNVGTLSARNPGITATVGTQPIARYGAEPQKFLVVKQPTWLNTGKASFENGSYVYTGVAPAAAELSVTTPGLPSIPWLNVPEVAGKTSSVSLTSNLTVMIPVVKAQTATARVNSLAAELKVLGVDVWNEAYNSSNASFSVGMTLDPNTLEPTDLKLALTNVPQTIGNITFLENTFTVPIVTPLKPVVTITASLGITLTGSAKLLGAGLELTWSDDQLAWVPAGTFINLQASGTGTIRAEGTAEVADGWLGTYTAYGKVSATLTLTGSAELGGPIADAHLISPSLTATLNGSYFYSFDGFLGTKKSTATEQDQQNQPDGTFGPITLFTL